MGPAQRRSLTAPVLVAARTERKNDERLSAAVAAIRKMGVLTGHRIERKEIGAPGEFDNITDDELKRAIIDRFVRLGLGRVMSALGQEQTS